MSHTETQREALDQLAAEFVEALRAGKTPALSDYADRYPQHAAQIHDLFPTLVKLEQLAPAPQSWLNVPLGEADQVGHYRILGEIGRGGMGVVYEAQDMRLDRFVALKILPSRMGDVGNSLERFEREARSAGRLHHTHIVPVFEAGQADGFHFIAMQKIDGQSLDEVLREIIRLRREHGLAGQIAPDPQASREGVGEPRQESLGSTDRHDLGWSETLVDSAATGQRRYFSNVARLGMQVADAISYAHSQGVVHRDLKPSNILIDNHQNAWITDFGLAKLDEDSLTSTGDIVGTLRYMAPERFHGQADDRGDVYGIGITLYEMLAFAPAFPESDRAQLLRHISDHDPPPLRRANPWVPADLETIIGRAIARNPADRYASAEDLGEDLRLFLANRPIKARNTSLGEALVRWYRRKPALSTAITALVCVFLFGFLAVAWQWQRANAFLAQSRQETARAEDNFQQAQQLVDLLTEVSQDKLRDIPSAKSVRRELLSEALRYYQGFLTQSKDQDRTTKKIAHAYMQVASIKSNLTLESPADEYRNALDVYNRLVESQPEDRDLRFQRARASNGLGFSLASRDQAREAIPCYQLAIRDIQAIRDAGPIEDQHTDMLALARNNIGFAHVMLKELAEAELHYQQSLALRKQLVADEPDDLSFQSSLAQLYNDIAYLHLVKRDYDKALKWNREAIDIRTRLAEQDPDEVHYQYNCVRSLNQTGDVYRSMRDYPAAIAKYKESLSLNLELHDRHPELPTLLHGIANSYVNLAWTYERTRQLEEAEEAYRGGISVFETLIQADPDSLRRSRQLTDALWKLADLLIKTGKVDEAHPLIGQLAELKPDIPARCNHIAWHMFLYPQAGFDYRHALACSRQAVASQPNSPHFLNTLGSVQYRLGHYRDAIETLKQVGGADGQAMTAFDFYVIAMSHYRLGDEAEARNWYHRAQEWLELQEKIPGIWRMPLESLAQEADELLGVAITAAAAGFRGVPCGGTYPHHLQGICVDDQQHIYWCFTTTLVKTDTQGKVIQQVAVGNHHGDLCHHEGKLYVAVNFGKFNDPKGQADSWVYVYDAADLSLTSKHPTPEVFHGAGGIGYRDGRFFVVGGLPAGVEENYVYEYDMQLKFQQKHVIQSGQTRLGIQTATFADGRWWFGCYGSPKILLVTDAEFKLEGRYEFDCSLGIVGLPDGRMLSASGRCTPQQGCTGQARIAVGDPKSGLKYLSE